VGEELINYSTQKPTQLIMIDPIDISIPAGTKVIQCSKFTPTGSRVSCDNKNQLLNQNDGQIQYDSASGTAVFKAPDFNSCIDPRQLLCEVEFILPKSSLKILKASNSDLSDLISTNTPIPPSPQPATPQPLKLPEIPPTQEPLPGYILPIGIVAGISLVVVLVANISNRLSNSNKSSKSTTRPSSRPATNVPKNQLTQFTATTAPSNDSIKQITFLTQQLQKVTSKINELEDEIIGLSQRLQSIEGKSSSPKIDQIFPSLNTVITSVIPAPPPAPLSVDLIKKAVSSGDYTLISAHPHFFVSETSQSQQGLEEVKRFMIDGDQSQASSRTQSEFIAIICNTETYLIPNIVPNAADPSRTLKRHADKNNIYRNGQGTSLLNLDQLAVVQRNGDRFDLITLGQIA
jgi:hypothetical protein